MIKEEHLVITYKKSTLGFNYIVFMLFLIVFSFTFVYMNEGFTPNDIERKTMTPIECIAITTPFVFLCFIPKKVVLGFILFILFVCLVESVRKIINTINA